jgi:hypothetical protein
VGIFPNPRTWRELFRAIGKPDVDVVCRPRGKIHQQLHELELRIHLVPEAAAGQAGQDRCGQSAAPFQWTFTREDLAKLMTRLKAKDLATAA